MKILVMISALVMSLSALSNNKCEEFSLSAEGSPSMRSRTFMLHTQCERIAMLVMRANNPDESEIAPNYRIVNLRESTATIREGMSYEITTGTCSVCLEN